MIHETTTPAPAIGTQDLLRNSAHVFGEISHLLSEMEVRLDRETGTSGISANALLGQDFDLLSQTVEELRDMFLRLSEISEIDSPVSYADVLAPIKVARLRDLMGTANSPLPSLQRKVDKPLIQLF
ncbi:hypothetical protein [Yoonia sp.]|uniref:hypothetical protein n=1 Tax=Yoonia sp. TaxID=2212373 RepID=UPI0023B4E895